MSKSILLAGAALMTLSAAAIAQDGNPTTGTSVGTSAGAATEAGAAAQTPAPDASATTPAPDTGTATTAPTVATGGQAPAGAAGTTGTTGAAGASESSSTAAGAGTAGTSAAASASVQADWSKYDKSNAGYLTPLEFGSWVLASRGQDMTAQVEKTRQSKRADLPAVKVLNATAGEFVKADADHDRRITPAELSAYLGA